MKLKHIGKDLIFLKPSIEDDFLSVKYSDSVGTCVALSDTIDAKAVQEGDIVHFSARKNMEVRIDDENYFVINISDVIWVD